MMSKIWTNVDTFIRLSRKHCGKKRNCLLRAISPFSKRVLRGSVVKCLTCNPGVLGLSHTKSSGFFSWECPWARHFRAQPSTVQTQESMNNVSYHRDMTEILIKAA